MGYIQFINLPLVLLTHHTVIKDPLVVVKDSVRSVDIARHAQVPTESRKHPHSSELLWSRDRLPFTCRLWHLHSAWCKADPATTFSDPQSPPDSQSYFLDVTASSIGVCWNREWSRDSPGEEQTAKGWTV